MTDPIPAGSYTTWESFKREHGIEDIDPEILEHVAELDRVIATLEAQLASKDARIAALERAAEQQS